MSTRVRTLPVPARCVAGAVALCVLAGCSTAAEPASTAANHPTGSHPATAPAGATTPGDLGPVVRVGLTEWTILTAGTPVPAGRVRFVVTNTGATEHDLWVRGRRGTWHSPHLAPGERVALRVGAAPGERLTLWCSVAGHEAQGMHTTLRVTH